MPEKLPLPSFLSQPGPMLDVRSPSEFLQGHIPGSLSLPLFSDQERAEVGTIYKQKGQEPAVDLALQLVGPKLHALVQTGKKILGKEPGRILCWRGGMRSGFMARLFESIGYTTSTLQGGYKSFRRFALQLMSDLPPAKLYVIGGLTGSGKTAVLRALKNRGEQVLDLEELAHHRGSAFGSWGLPPQPSQEHFENELAAKWSSFDLNRPVWVEDESRLIGTCHLPPSLSKKIYEAPLFYIEKSLEERLQNLLELYGAAPSSFLKDSTYKITKRLGSELTASILHLLENAQTKEAFKLLLNYYDKAYQHQTTKRPHSNFIASSGLSAEQMADRLVLYP